MRAAARATKHKLERKTPLMNTTTTYPAPATTRIVRVLEPDGHWQGYTPKAIVYEILLSLATNGAAHFSIAALAGAVGASYHTTQDALRRLCTRGVISRRWLPGELDDGSPVYSLSVPYQVVHLSPALLAADRRPVSIYWLTSEVEEAGAVYSVPSDRLRPHVAKVLGFVGVLAGASGALATSARIVARACSLTPGIAAQALRELETSGHIRRLPVGSVPTAPGLVLYQLTGPSALTQGIQGSGDAQQQGLGTARRVLAPVPDIPVVRFSADTGRKRIGAVRQQGTERPSRMGCAYSSYRPFQYTKGAWSRGAKGSWAVEVLRPYIVIYERHPLPIESCQSRLTGVAA